ncbi:MAG: histidine phosphatase family protein [Elusimicrobiaceae bacterium]|nr:histidine phosphatase family protein [Elusimicrobiaceae bacterium]
MKTLILMRHGKADPYAESDFSRPLLPTGRERVLRSAQALLSQQTKPELFFASPLLRAQQTAEIVARVLQVPFQTQDLLDGRLSAKGLLEFIQTHLQEKDSLLLVGHNPNMSILASLLCKEYVSFEPGQYMCFDMTDFSNPKFLAGA